MVRDSLEIVLRLFRTKLGRCTRCMRSARNGAVIALLAVSTALLLKAPSWICAGTVLVASAFVALAIAHSIAYTWRDRARAMRIRDIRRSVAAEPAVGLSRRAMWKAGVVAT